LRQNRDPMKAPTWLSCGNSGENFAPRLRRGRLGEPPNLTLRCSARLRAGEAQIRPVTPAFAFMPTCVIFSTPFAWALCQVRGVDTCLSRQA
jgi:hypothetical protein